MQKYTEYCINKDVFFVIVETFPHSDLNGNTDRLLYICLVFELSFPHFGNNYCFC